MSHAATPVEVVVVDDSVDIRDVLRMALERDSAFTVVGEAGDGEAGLALVSRLRPQLVLLDIALPVMDGLQALPLMREESPESVIVMLTGFAEDVAALSAVEHGAHGFIRKGIPVPELLAQIREVLDLRLGPRD